MKIFYSLLFYLLLSIPASAQQQLAKVAKDYYRVNPFGGPFSAFLKALTTDPDLLDKTIVLKTDTTNYFVRGNYKVFNPFSINAERVDLIFTEEERDVIVRNTQSIYRNYAYQITAFFNDTKEARKRIIKDYEKIKKRLNRDVPGRDIQSLKGVKNIEDGEIANYYYRNPLIYPVTLSWQTLSSSKRIAITLILRLVINDNRAAPVGTVSSAPAGDHWEVMVSSDA